MYRLRRRLAFRFTFLKHSFRLRFQGQGKMEGWGVRLVVVAVSGMAKRATKLVVTRDVAGARARGCEDTRAYRGAYHIRFGRLARLGSLLELALPPLGLSHLLTTRALAVVHLRFSDRPLREIE